MNCRANGRPWDTQGEPGWCLNVAELRTRVKADGGHAYSRQHRRKQGLLATIQGTAAGRAWARNTAVATRRASGAKIAMPALRPEGRCGWLTATGLIAVQMALTSKHSRGARPLWQMRDTPTAVLSGQGFHLNNQGLIRGNDWATNLVNHLRCAQPPRVAWKWAVGTIGATAPLKHFMAVVVERARGRVEYFDPMGGPPTPALGRKLELLREELEEQEGRPFVVWISDQVHQEHSGECGVYTLWYIYNRLRGLSMSMLDSDALRDDEVCVFRSHFFSQRFEPDGGGAGPARGQSPPTTPRGHPRGHPRGSAASGAKGKGRARHSGYHV